MHLVAERPEDQHVLDPLDPVTLVDRGAPIGENPLDVRVPAVFELLGRFLSVLAEEGVGDGLNELRVRRHVMLPSGKNRSGAVSATLSEPLPKRPPSARLDSQWRDADNVRGGPFDEHM